MITARSLARWLAVLLAGCALALAAAAQSGVTVDCPPQAQALTPEEVQLGVGNAKDRGFLWRISRDGRVSYLYGTLHVAKPAWVFPGPLTAQALRASDTVALELDKLDADIQRELVAAMAADPDERLPEAMQARLDAQLREACLPPEAMAKLAPAIQLAALSTLVARRDGLDPSYAIDGFLAGIARSLGKRVVSLESPALQVTLLKGDPKTALRELDQGLEELENGSARPKALRIAQVWADGRSEELQRYEQWCDCIKDDADRAALKRLLDDRNPGLADRIDALHASGARVFAAVGSLHMTGPAALPTLMARRGYAVEQVIFGR